LNGNTVKSKILKTHLYTVRLALRAMLLGENREMRPPNFCHVTVTLHIHSNLARIGPLTAAFEYFEYLPMVRNYIATNLI
jgi:hypothetical protein